jgi:hypothetical protein
MNTAEAHIAKQLSAADAAGDHRDRLEAALSREVGAVETVHLLTRQMQAAYAVGLRDGPSACLDWLGNALAGPGNLPLDAEPDPAWYADDAWTEFGRYAEYPIPYSCRTRNEPGAAVPETSGDDPAVAVPSSDELIGSPHLERMRLTIPALTGSPEDYPTLVTVGYDPRSITRRSESGAAYLYRVEELHPEHTVMVFDGTLNGPATGRWPEPEELALTALSFATLRPGDVEEDYFNDYSDVALDWRDRYAEMLSLIVADFQALREEDLDEIEAVAALTVVYDLAWDPEWFSTVPDLVTTAEATAARWTGDCETTTEGRDARPLSDAGARPTSVAEDGAPDATDTATLRNALADTATQSVPAVPIQARSGLPSSSPPAGLAH